MIRYEVWCYRCREREDAEVNDEPKARERIEDFRREHIGSCGVGTSFGFTLFDVPSLTGDGAPR